MRDVTAPWTLPVLGRLTIPLEFIERDLIHDHRRPICNDFNIINKVAAMVIKSLIAQLLSDVLKIGVVKDLEFSTKGLDPYVIQKVMANDVMALCSLFCFLLCQLPKGMTVLIMIDEIDSCTKKDEETVLFFSNSSALGKYGVKRDSQPTKSWPRLW